MNHEREHEHDLQHDPLVRANDAAVPGRASRSAAMSAPAQPMVSGLLMRKASGGDVDANAEQAVGRAGASSGHGLPDGLREKFEGSIGTDLSAVRVHTGGESQQAAAAVGARAYAVGNDIHFGAGEYDPQSSSGQHLIAHEVAHTVQQRGGTPTRQNKLAVSSSSDSFEAEADRAASAMVAGAPASVGGTSMVVARKEGAGDAGKEAEAEKPRYPSWKDEDISVPFGKFGSIKVNYGEKPSATVALKKEAKGTLFEKKYSQQVQIEPGIIGMIVGGVSVEVAASGSIEGKGEWFKAEGKEEQGAVWSIAGKGTVGIEAKGSLQLSLGAGIANVIGVTGGVKGEISATASSSITVAGAITKNPDGSELGMVQMITSLDAGLSASAGLVVDLVVPEDNINLYEKELGKLEIGKLQVACTAMYANGKVTDLPPVVVAQWLPVPPMEQRQKRPLTAAEKAQYKPHSAVEDGGSGAGPEGTREAPDGVEMTDQELFDGGKKAAAAALGKAASVTLPVQTKSNINGVMPVVVIVDGVPIKGIAAISPQRRVLDKEHGREATAVTKGVITDWQLVGSPSVDIVAKCAKTTSAVAHALLANHINVTVAGSEFEYKQVPIERCKVDNSTPLPEPMPLPDSQDKMPQLKQG